ncbi:MAG TPA: hypothetical protein VGB92_11675 [Longimicrobium sp.]|jgi:hypothetical protein
MNVPEVPARLSFSGQATEGRARVLERTPRWRRTAALKELAWWLLAPAVFFIPPHIPWVLLVLGLGAFRAFGRLREHRTLLWLEGPCPKCGTAQDYAELGRMRDPHMVQCSSCRWSVQAEVARGAPSPGPPPAGAQGG